MKILLLTLLLSSNSFALSLKGKIGIKDKKGNPITTRCDKSVVFLEPTSKDAVKLPAKKIKMLLKDRLFQPGILPIYKGTTVSFPNEDTILHNVFSLSKTKKFDLGLYRKSSGKEVTFDKSGLVKVFCNIHEGMVGDILILDYPWFARVGENCEYEVKDIPKGEYSASVWYKFGKGKKVAVNMSSNKAQDFTVKHTKKRRKHKKKNGKSYSDSY